MSSMPDFGNITDQRSGAALTCRVVTRATNAEIAGTTEEGSLKIRLTAQSAGEAAANEELLAFLSKILNVPLNQFEVVAGASGREKLVSIEGISTAELEERLGKA